MSTIPDPDSIKQRADRVIDVTRGLMCAAEVDGKEALSRARATLGKALEELDLYCEKFDAANDSQRKAEVLNWALHYLSTGISPNLRLDMLANAQARLVSLRNH